ncbi:MAG TPA: DUF2914 domain-containing protein [Candidatus Krumholzibacteria bacterium]|nr:DUF2914 domain-containing protein [Candidatus Krumholzibacteria bacterium]HPD72747.1 DUF2914 domain-containing protein [Candidatus Krumholzibacteria bacterium]HRY40321.1 DUF2914 domain-containing protein [Candidatus Krumholzibacteria bacterium]
MRNLSIPAVVIALAAGALVVAASAQPAAVPAAGGELVVAEMAVGTGYDRDTRTLAGEGTSFPADCGRLWCRTRITGAAGSGSVSHVWYHEGKTMARVDLAVESGDWRTVSSKQLLPAWTGAWEVKVLDAAGTVLRTASFTVQ